MGKRNAIIAIMVLLFMILGFVTYSFFEDGHAGFDIEIKNNTSENISGLAITYQGITKDIILPEIKAGETYNLNVNPKEDSVESDMIIYYQDKRGYTQKNVIIGYFEKGYKGEVKVNINSRDENGLIIMQVQENIKW